MAGTQNNIFLVHNIRSIDEMFDSIPSNSESNENLVDFKPN